MVEARGEEQQEPGPGSNIHPGLCPGSGSQGMTMAGDQTWNQFIDLAMGPEAETATAVAAITAEVVHSAEVGIGVVMTANHLTRLCEDRPTSLKMQRYGITIKTKLKQIAMGEAHQLSNQSMKIWMVLKLPTAMKIASPGTTRRRVARGLTP